MGVGNLTEFEGKPLQSVAKGRPRPGQAGRSEEEKKGNQLARETFRVLKASDLNFVGNIEGQNLSKGMADVVVTDGFTGNIVLKTLEGIGEAFLKSRMTYRPHPIQIHYNWRSVSVLW